MSHSGESRNPVLENGNPQDVLNSYIISFIRGVESTGIRVRREWEVKRMVSTFTLSASVWKPLCISQPLSIGESRAAPCFVCHDPAFG